MSAGDSCTAEAKHRGHGGIVRTGGERYRDMQSEDLVVSPELALVDPELAARMRSLGWVGYWLPIPPPENENAVPEAAPAAEPGPEQTSHEPVTDRMPVHRRIGSVALTLSLALNVFVLVNVYDDATQSAPVASGPAVRTTAMFLQPPPMTAVRAALAAAAASAAAERRVRAALPTPGVSVHCGHPLPLSGRPLVPCLVSRLVAGELVANAVQYRELAHGRFLITVIG